MLTPWHEFYGLLGTAAAALMALMFVAVSVGVGILSSERASGTRIYLSPVIMHYANILFVSLMALAPSLGDRALGSIVGACGVVGFAYSLFVSTTLFRDGKAEFVDRFAYGAWPCLGYGGIVVAAVMIAARHEFGPTLLAAALILLLMVNVRNAWDLAITFVRRHSDMAHNMARNNQPPSGPPPAPPPLPPSPPTAPG
jgi:hypothetical protein